MSRRISIQILLSLVILLLFFILISSPATSVSILNPRRRFSCRSGWVIFSNRRRPLTLRVVYVSRPRREIGVEKVDDMKERERKKEKDCPVSQLLEFKAHAKESAKERDVSRGSGDEKKKKMKILEDKSRLKDDKQIKEKIKHSPSVDHKEIAKDGVDGKPSTSSPPSKKTKIVKEKKSQKDNSIANTLERPPIKSLEGKTVEVVNGKVNNEISSPEEEAGLDESEVSTSKKKRKKEKKSILDDKKSSSKKKKRVKISQEVEVEDMEQARKKEKDYPLLQLLESKGHAKESVKERYVSRGSGDEKKKKKIKILEDKSRLKDENQIKKKITHSLSVDHKEIVRDGVNGKPSTSSSASNKTNTGKEKKSQNNNSIPNTPEPPPMNNLEEKTVEVVNGKVNDEIYSPEKEVDVDESEVSCSRKKRKREKKSILVDKKTYTKKKKRRVSFSEEVEVFSLSDNTVIEEIEENLIQGKRFTPEEDDIIRNTIAEYIEAHQLGEEGEHMIMHCRDYPKIKDCWKTIAASLPHRPRSAIYYRGHSLLERSKKAKWTPEEYDMLRRLVQKHGRDWRKLGDMLGKYRFHVKDAWRRVGSPSFKKGAWSQDEYQSLFDLVNFDLQMKVNEKKNSKYGMLKDNIHWEAISKKLSSRYNAACCLKWYRQLTSPLVTKGLWNDVDDYLLIDKVQKVDACCEDDVDWDNLLDHRSGDVCRTRWNEMVRHIGGRRRLLLSKWKCYPSATPLK